MTEKVRLFDNERFDIPDALALQNLVYEYVGRVLGAVIGGGSGALTSPAMDYGTTPYSSVKFGPMYLYDQDANQVIYPFGEELSGDPAEVTDYKDSSITTGKVVFYDSDRTLQSIQTIDLSPFKGSTAANSSVAFLWARRQEVEADFDNRMRWEDTSEVLVGGSTPLGTRTREIVELGVTAGFGTSAWEGSSGENYGFRWGKIGWDDSTGVVVPKLYIYSPFDIARGTEATGANNDPINWNAAPISDGAVADLSDFGRSTFSRYLHNESTGGNSPYLQFGTSGGLATLQRLVLHTLLMIKGNHDGNADWSADVERNLKQIDGVIRLVENAASNFLQIERVTAYAGPLTDSVKGTDEITYKATKHHFIHTDCFVRGTSTADGKGTLALGSQTVGSFWENSNNDFLHPYYKQGIASAHRFGEQRQSSLASSNFEADRNIIVRRVSQGYYTLVVKYPENLPNEPTTAGQYNTDKYGRMFQVQSLSVQPVIEDTKGSKTSDGAITSSVVSRGSLDHIIEQNSLSKTSPNFASESSTTYLAGFTNEIDDPGSFEISRKDKIFTIKTAKLLGKTNGYNMVPGIKILHYYKIDAEQYNSITAAGVGTGVQNPSKYSYVPVYTPCMVNAATSPFIPLVQHNASGGPHGYILFGPDNAVEPEDITTITADGTTFNGPFPAATSGVAGSGEYQVVPLRHTGGGLVVLAWKGSDGSIPAFNFNTEVTGLGKFIFTDVNFALTIIGSYVPQIGQNFSHTSVTAGPSYKSSDAFAEK